MLKSLIFKAVLVATISCCWSEPMAEEPPSFRHHNPDDYRLCVPDAQYSLCRNMIAGNARHDGPHHIECVSAPDKIACIDRIIKGDADLTILDPEQLYIAYRYLPQNGVVVTSEIRSQEYADRDFRYAPVAVVRKSSNIQNITDLQGKRSCHTGFGRNAGWKVPFSFLFIQKDFKCSKEPLNALERDLQSVKDYFGPSCIPGTWDLDKNRDISLKQKYSQLCELCNDKESCSMGDLNGGYDGTLKCLTENNGDIAWTKFDAVRDYFRLNESTPSDIADQYELLCRDGTRQPLTSENPCSFAQRPWKTIVMTNHLSDNYKLIDDLQSEITNLRTQALASNPAPEWLTKVLGFQNETDVIFHHKSQKVKTLTPQAYLKSTNYAQTFWHPSCGITEKSLKICVYNQVELEKCQALRLAAIGQRIFPGFSCITGTCPGACSRMVSKGDADLLILSGALAYKVETSDKLTEKLTPILREIEATDDPKVTVPFRYALAVITSQIAGEFQGNLNALKGKRSCHGSVRNMAGVYIPMTVLRDAGEISGESCDLPVEISKYFSKSCVPGAPEAKYKIPNLPEEQLCSICAGDGTAPGKALNPETVCQDNSNERYQGAAGALRCLSDEVADVAFIDHVGLQERMKTSTKEALDVKLLCRNGTVASLQDYRSCNWGMTPTQKVLARAGDNDKILRENARLSLLRAQEMFRPGGKNEDVFKLFGIYYGTNNIIFQDSSLGFQDELSEEEREQENKIIKEFIKCKKEGHHHGHGKARNVVEWEPKEQI